MRARFRYELTIVAEYDADDFSSEEEAQRWFTHDVARNRMASSVVEQMVRNSEVDEVESSLELISMTTLEVWGDQDNDTCPDCEGTGMVMHGPNEVTCGTCEGAKAYGGQTEADRAVEIATGEGPPF